MFLSCVRRPVSKCMYGCFVLDKDLHGIGVLQGMTDASAELCAVPAVRRGATRPCSSHRGYAEAA